MTEDSGDRSGSGAFGALLAGIGCGLAVGLLCAPRSGRETRRLIVRKTHEMKESVDNATRECRSVVGNAVDSVGGAVEDIRAQVTDTVEVVRSQMTGNLQDAKEKLQEAFRAGKRVYLRELGNLNRD
jgi:gas vesicle protein